MDYSVFA